MPATGTPWLRRRAAWALAIFVLVAAPSVNAPARPDASGSSAAGPTVADRPNIVLVLTDDQAMSEMRFMPLTRRLLGSAGATFTEFISPHPLCCPARAQILSGQFAHNNGVRGNSGSSGGWQALRDKQDTIGSWLQQAGYDTAFVGKFLHGYDRTPTEVPPGWTSWNGTAAGMFNFTDFTLNHDGTLTEYTDVYQTDVVRRLGNELVAQWAPSSRPFFLWINHVAPHTEARDGQINLPPPAAPRHADSYRSLVPPAFSDPAFDEADVADKPEYVRARPQLTETDKAGLLELARARARSLTAVDEAVASLVATLRQAGELSNTVIFFTSDNGYLLGEHRLRSKNIPYEQSLRVPLLVRGPGVPAGVQRSQQMSLVDLSATIAGLAGAKRYATRLLDGRSLMPAARFNSRVGLASMLVQAAAGGWFWRGVRTERYTYVRYSSTGEVEMYDRAIDPHQLSSVHDSPAYAGVREVLAAQLQQRASCRGPSCWASLPVPPEPALGR